MLTVITPAYNEAANLAGLYERLLAMFAAEGVDWEWIVVDDFSRDATPTVIEGLASRDPRVRGVRFARNHGSHAAIFYGLHHARGDAAVVLAGDMQDPPETVPEMLRRWRAGAQVVWAVRRLRVDERKRNVGFARLYYFIMRNIVGLKQMPASGADFFLLDRQVIEAVRQFREQHVSVFALLSWLGFRQESLEYDKQPRAAGSSGWTLVKKINLVSDSVTAFSDAPLRAGAALGGVVFVAGLLALILSLAGLNVGGLSPGWLLLASTILIVGGLQLTMMGVIGEYLWRALDEARQRPRFVVERRFGRHEPAAEPDAVDAHNMR